MKRTSPQLTLLHLQLPRQTHLGLLNRQLESSNESQSLVSVADTYLHAILNLLVTNAGSGDLG